ncbi:MAG TPA: AAA family ATPase [Candidatus Saccharibacteria bacterium]|nr:AAA family ATPase [Candidatus Saccharibacteria bacterium]
MIYIADTLASSLNALSETPPQAVLLSGPRGRGLMHLAKYTAGQWGTLEHIVQPVSSKSSTAASISVEAIRDLYTQTKTKSKTATFVIIHDADAMSLPAQNALLKLLEEPASNTHFILTTHAPDRLLTTVRSRCQQMIVPPITTSQSKELLQSLGQTNETKQRQMLFVAEGNPAELFRLATDEIYFKEVSEQIEDVKQFVSGDSYAQFKTLLKYSATRPQCLEFIARLLTVMDRLVVSSPKTSSILRIEKLIELKEAIEANGNIRLQIAASVV